MLICLRRLVSGLVNEPILKSLTFPIHSFETGQVLPKTVTLRPEAFSVSLRTDLVHNALHYYQMLGKVTTHRTQRRKDIESSKRKVRPQKGSGRARAGFRFAPRMRGGVKAHGPFPRDYSIKMNKKVILQALKITLAAKLNEKTMIIVDSYPENAKKTKEVAKITDRFNHKALFIYSEELSTDFLLASRRLAEFSKVSIKEVNVKNLILAKTILITEKGILDLQENIINNQKKLYMNRKLYRKVKEENKKNEKIEPVIVKSKILKEIVKKYELDVETA